MNICISINIISLRTASGMCVETMLALPTEMSYFDFYSLR